jgi:transcription antitermination factor NusG
MQFRELGNEAQVEASAAVGLLVPAEYTQPRWYAVYTAPRHEKAVHEHFTMRDLPCYLPLYTAASRWKDRVAKVEMPLFPGYIFVHIALTERVPVLSTPGVLRLVGFNGRPAPLPQDEIEALQQSLAVRKAEPYPYLSAGKRVRITAGPLQGLSGVVLRRKGQLRLIVSIDSIARSVALEVEAADVQLAS